LKSRRRRGAALRAAFSMMVISADLMAIFSLSAPPYGMRWL
jgi:hypothetical protein